MNKTTRPIRINEKPRTYLQYISPEFGLILMAFRSKKSLNRHLKYIEGCEILYCGLNRPRYKSITSQEGFNSLEHVRKHFVFFLEKEEQQVGEVVV